MTNVASTGTTTSTFTYDAVGNTLTRAIPGSATQNLTWDAEGRLDTLTQGITNHDYTYTADGDRLIRNQNGVKTAYLPGGLELTQTGTTVKATRYYSFAGRTVAMRTGFGASNSNVLISDHHGTAELSINNSTTLLTRRYHDPYGVPRGTTATWPGDHGFLNKPTDNTGLTHIGARYYDPTLGRFITPDPLIDRTQPQQWAAYTYANANPTTLSDPTGLAPTSMRNDATTPLKYDFLARHLGIPSIFAAAPVTTRPTPPPATPTPTTTQARQTTKKPVTQAQIIARITAPGGILKAKADNPWATAGHLFLDGLGLVPGFGEGADALNGIWYAAEGDWGNASLSFAATAPLAGWGITGAKWVKRGADAVNTAARACSFAGTTAVLMADGTRKAIEEVRAGDKVVATDPEAGEQAEKTVEQVFVHDDTVIDLVVEDEVITTTEDHRFWSVNDGRFVRADELEDGDRVLGADGRAVTVSGLRLGTAREEKAYNLAVEGIHTYHVGNEAVLVHNECSDAAYQGVRHIRDEIEQAGGSGSHSWAARMSDDELESYLNGFITRGGGQRLDDGTVGWYDPDRGVAIIQRNEYSMTAYSMQYSDFLGRLAS